MSHYSDEKLSVIATERISKLFRRFIDRRIKKQVIDLCKKKSLDANVQLLVEERLIVDCDLTPYKTMDEAGVMFDSYGDA
ncbi:hypothetical protein [Aliagarivorans marinus]|uniref:hypothetical protein n=1 Tax=Aliagarivorans marinus TaxID=561965 RepID=UPI00047BBE5F|nr:hypothetical protein [Aliagarivorans marinus]